MYKMLFKLILDSVLQTTETPKSELQNVIEEEVCGWLADLLPD